jgi:hypothetical protein
MTLIFKVGDVEIWRVVEAYGADFYVYGVMTGGDPVVCPSLGMAREIAARGLR